MSTTINVSNHFISLEKAKEMIALHNRRKAQVLREEYKEKNLLPVSETFDRSAFDRLLSIPGCTAVRIYYGMDDDNRQHAILVAVNENNEDILPKGNQPRAFDISISETSIMDPVIIEEGRTCPPYCFTSLLTDLP